MNLYHRIQHWKFNFRLRTSPKLIVLCPFCNNRIGILPTQETLEGFCSHCNNPIYSKCIGFVSARSGEVDHVHQAIAYMIPTLSIEYVKKILAEAEDD